MLGVGVGLSEGRGDPVGVGDVVGRGVDVGRGDTDGLGLMLGEVVGFGVTGTDGVGDGFGAACAGTTTATSVIATSVVSVLRIGSALDNRDPEWVRERARLCCCFLSAARA